MIAADQRIERTVAVGVDEHTFQHANARRRTQMATTFVDIDRARLLDVVPGRSGDVVRDWVTERPDGWADQIQVATIDAFRGYATAIGDVLPDATLVIDHPLEAPPVVWNARISSRQASMVRASRVNNFAAIDSIAFHCDGYSA